MTTEPTLRVRDVMTADVIVFNRMTTFKEAVQLMALHRISGAPVVDDEGGLVGICTEGDLVLHEAAKGPPRRSTLGRLSFRTITSVPAPARVVGELMTRDVDVVGPDDDLRMAARLLIGDRPHRMVPVVEHGRLVGVLARRDVLQAFGRSDEEIAATVGHVLRHNGFIEPDATIDVRIESGIIGLVGDVRTEADIERATKLARDVDGVVDVVTGLLVRTADADRRVEQT